MDYKLPYYLAHPCQELLGDEKLCRRDREYMKSIYPEIAKLLLPYVEQECDRLEYDGSLIYDEYPDKLLLRLMCSRVHRRAEKELQNHRIYESYSEQLGIRDMIELLVYQELCKRRAEWRNRQRWY